MTAKNHIHEAGLDGWGDWPACVCLAGWLFGWLVVYLPVCLSGCLS